MSCGQPTRVPSGAYEAIVAPDVVRFAIQIVDRLHFTRMKKCHEETAHDADILDLENEPVRRSLRNVHLVHGRAGEVIDLFIIKHRAASQLIGREVLAAATWLRAG